MDKEYFYLILKIIFGFLTNETILTLSLNQNLKFLVIFDQVVATIRLVKFEAKSFLHFIF